MCHVISCKKCRFHGDSRFCGRDMGTMWMTRSPQRITTWPFDSCKSAGTHFRRPTTPRRPTKTPSDMTATASLTNWNRVGKQLRDVVGDERRLLLCLLLKMARCAVSRPCSCLGRIRNTFSSSDFKAMFWSAPLSTPLLIDKSADTGRSMQTPPVNVDILKTWQRLLLLLLHDRRTFLRSLVFLHCPTSRPPTYSPAGDGKKPRQTGQTGQTKQELIVDQAMGPWQKEGRPCDICDRYVVVPRVGKKKTRQRFDANPLQLSSLSLRPRDDNAVQSIFVCSRSSPADVVVFVAPVVCAVCSLPPILVCFWL